MDELADAFAPLGGHDCGRIKPPQRDVDQWRPILPVPADAPTLTNSMAQRFASGGYAFSRGLELPRREWSPPRLGGAL